MKPVMNRDEVIFTLRAREEDMRAHGVIHAALPWKDVAGSGSICRHNYKDVQERRIWATIHEALPALDAVVEAALRE